MSLPPLSSAETTLTFDAPGTLLYICHVPGHEAYGMVGRLKIT
ncbi:MAG: cupredoxin domain-containing protein [Candidatus Limnocylindria bacterium]